MSVPAVASFEWVAFDAAWPPDAAGAAVDAAVALPVAPARWWLPAPNAATLEALYAAAAAGRGALIEVTGRWHRIPLQDPAPLSAAVSVEAVLRDRDVASLWLFDCPVILARQQDMIACWVEASYAASFLAMLEAAG